MERFHQLREIRALEDVEFEDVHSAVVGILSLESNQEQLMDVELPEIQVLRDDNNDGQLNAQQLMEKRVEEENGVQNPKPNCFQVDHDGIDVHCAGNECQTKLSSLVGTHFASSASKPWKHRVIRGAYCAAQNFSTMNHIIFPNN